MAKFSRHWLRLVFLIVATSIYVIANLAPVDVAIGTASDKLNHIMAFVVLAILAALAFPHVRLPILFALLLVFNAFIELSQAALNVGRQPDVVDWAVGAAATVPVLIGIALFRMSRSRIKT